MNKNKFSRRIFLMGTAATVAGCATVRKPKLSQLGYVSPNAKLNIAAIGAGGKGGSDINGCSSENVVALCDADWERAASTFRKFPSAKRYRDYREMLDRENIDAVTVSTPDHHHAPAAIEAIQRGIHVYCQKPLTHNIYEARTLTEAAKEYGVSTQMGNQGHSGDGVRELCEWVWSNAIGPIREVHAWTNRPIWPQGIADPLPAEPVPDHIDWNLWLGPAPWRPYNSGYAPFKWRGWYDFGTGALGDMACHILDPANWSLKLTAPISVESLSQDTMTTQTYPNKSIIRFEFPARGVMPPVTLTWYDGGNMPPRPEGLDPDDKIGDSNERNGSLFIGDDGILTTGTYGGGTRLLPSSKMKSIKQPQKLIPRSPGHYVEWIQACKDGIPSPGNFSYAGPFTEWVLLGCIALRCKGKLMWDSKRMRFTNSDEANELIKRDYRRGWIV